MPPRPAGGCDFPADPAQEAPAAPVFWIPKAAPAAVTLLARVDGADDVTITLDPDSIDIRREADGLLLLRLKTGELLALRPSDLRKPVGILLPLDDRWPARQANAGRLRARLLGLRAPPDPLTLQQRRRIAMALRALDGREAQAVLRTIAAHLYGADRVRGEHWKTSPLKAQVARLIAHGRHLTEHGYRALLLGQKPTGRGKRGD